MEYRINKRLYELLSKTVANTQVLSVVDTSNDRLSSYVRIEDTKSIISEDILRRASSVVTAHKLLEYRPNHLKLEMMMMSDEELIIDKLLDMQRSVRGVQMEMFATASELV